MTSKYNQIKQDLLRRGRLFEDPEFPADRSSLLSGSGSYGVVWRRPHELVSKPYFIHEGATRFDLYQGELGDCWFVSAAACLSLANPKLFHRCVPADQPFDKDYAGIFKFQFWYYNEWVEVIIDDRLPTKNGQLHYASNRSRPNEFWPALLEKAYAKLYGGYQSIHGGHINDALVDFTGGISEFINIRDKENIPQGLFAVMCRTMKMNSMMGCSIETALPGEEPPSNDLYANHAYAIIDLVQIDNEGESIQLVKLRNPWGEWEWTGAWSDQSEEWKKMPTDVKQQLHLLPKNEGEFWMSFSDWVANFMSIYFCHLYPDSLTEEVAKDMEKINWQTTSFSGRWVKGFNAGGCGNKPYEDLFWTNPQYSVEFKEQDDQDNDGMCSLVVFLIQKAPKLVFGDISMGISIFKLRYGHKVLLDGSNYEKDALLAYTKPGKLMNLREFSERFNLQPGVYVIIPSTRTPGKESDYLLRVYAEKKAQAREIDNSTEITIPLAETEEKSEVFRKYCAPGSDVMYAEELTSALNEIFSKDITRGFNIETARVLLAISEKGHPAAVDLVEFKLMIDNLNVWKGAFVAFDKDNNANIDTNELGAVFKVVGITVSRAVLEKLVLRYGGRTRHLVVEDFIHCCCRLVSLYKQFKVFSKGQASNKASLNMEEASTGRLLEANYNINII